MFDDLITEHAKEIHRKEQIIKVLEERSLRAEGLADKIKDENLALRKECYATKIELEEERGKNQKLKAHINRDYENSSIPSSQKPNRKKIANNREKTGKKPGGQPGHKGHLRKKQVPTSVHEIPAPKEYLNSPEYELTEIEKRRQLVGIKMVLNTTEYYTAVFSAKPTSADNGSATGSFVFCCTMVIVSCSQLILESFKPLISLPLRPSLNAKRIMA